MTDLVAAQRLPERLLANARLLPERAAILPLLPKHKMIAEVGVAFGDFSDLFIRICEPQRFIAIDLFDLHHVPKLWGRPTDEVFGGGTHGAFYRKRFSDVIAQGKLVILEGDSARMMATLDDASLDVVYIDAGHDYGSVKRDLAMARRKIKDDGWIILNDYTMTDVLAGNGPYGVIQAAHEFMIAEDWEIIYLALQKHMYCDIVLRKAGSAPVPLPDMSWFGTRSVELEQRIASLKAELDAMRHSTSWRITTPLRAIRRSLGV